MRPRRVPEPCRHCAWYRGAGECAVDGRCEGYADQLRRRVIAEQMTRYAGHQMRVTA